MLRRHFLGASAVLSAAVSIASTKKIAPTPARLSLEDFRKEISQVVGAADGSNDAETRAAISTRVVGLLREADKLGFIATGAYRVICDEATIPQRLSTKASWCATFL